MIVKYLQLILIIVVLLYVFVFLMRYLILGIFLFPGIKSEKLKYDKSNVIRIELDGGKKIVSWLFFDNKSDTTVYYFHWNWENLNYFDWEMNYIYSLWFNVLAMDFPWYWESSWFPFENATYEYSNAILDYWINELWLKKDNIILRWYSIWSTQAVHLAQTNDYKWLVLISPFSNSHDMSNRVLWFNLPKILFMKKAFSNSDKIKNIKIPTLIFHWNFDKVIPIWAWKLVHEKFWSDNVTFIEINWWWHNNLYYKFRDIFNENISKFLSSINKKSNVEDIHD